MAPSTSPDSPTPDAPAESFALLELERFYRFHSRIYDFTRPFLLFGRVVAARSLEAGPGDLVLDIGCGTGYNLKALAGGGATVVGVECSAPMRAKAAERITRIAEEARTRVRLDPRPYGTHDDYAGQARGILFSYSLSMIPPYTDVLARARADLRAGGRLAAVDFLDAAPGVRQSLRAAHVHLGPDRLETLRRLFPRHEARVRSVGLWRYFVFRGEV
jgi:S-adenosylmethionine-diacylgycerolhomoserine-N-methlytransferase